MPNGKWTRALIEIETDSGPVKIPARMLGPLAVHFGIGSHSKRITISHVRTGRRIASTATGDVAQQIAEALAELDWTTLQGNSPPPGLQAAVSSILKRFEPEVDYALERLIAQPWHPARHPWKPQHSPPTF